MQDIDAHAIVDGGQIDHAYGDVHAKAGRFLGMQDLIDVFLRDECECAGQHSRRIRGTRRGLRHGGEGARLFDSGGAWRLYEHRGHDVYRFFLPWLRPAPYKEAWLEKAGREGAVYLNPAAYPMDEPVDVLEFPLAELLFARLLPAHQGVELHACGVVDPSGKGYLFAGHSEDGKTTTARLWAEVPGAKVLSDDRIVLRREGGAWWIYGTPWHGEASFAADDRARVAAILLLRRGETNALDPLGPAEAVSSLLARSFAPLHDPAAIESTLALLEKAASDVPCFRFSFVPGPDAVGFAMGAV